MSLRKINEELKQAIIEYNNQLTADELKEEFRKAHCVLDGIIAKAKLRGDNCEEAMCFKNLPSEKAFMWLDNNGWIEPSWFAWDIIGEYICISEFDTVDVWISKVIPFLADYMDKHYSDYKKNEHGNYRFSTAIIEDTTNWDTYSEVLFLPFEYVCIMLQIESI